MKYFCSTVVRELRGRHLDPVINFLARQPAETVIRIEWLWVQEFTWHEREASYTQVVKPTNKQKKLFYIIISINQPPSVQYSSWSKEVYICTYSWKIFSSIKLRSNMHNYNYSNSLDMTLALFSPFHQLDVNKSISLLITTWARFHT